MKVFFDTNVYVGEALLGQAAERMIQATLDARWRIYASRYLLDELSRVLIEDLGFGRRLAILAERRIVRRSTLVEGGSTAQVPQDPQDSPILQSALGCGADYLVTNDRHLHALDGTEGLRIVSMTEFYKLLREQGLL